MAFDAIDLWAEGAMAVIRPPVGLDAVSPGRAVPLQTPCERDFASGKEREGVRRGRQCAETIKVAEEMLAIHLCFAAGVGASVPVPLIADISTKLALIAPIST